MSRGLCIRHIAIVTERKEEFKNRQAQDQFWQQFQPPPKPEPCVERPSLYRLIPTESQRINLGIKHRLKVTVSSQTLLDETTATASSPELTSLKPMDTLRS